MKAQLQSIESKLTIYVLIFSIILGAIFSALQIGFDYFGEKQRYDSATREMLTRQQKPASLALYNYDTGSLQTVLDSMRMSLGIVSSEIIEFNSDFLMNSGWSNEKRNDIRNSAYMNVYKIPLMEPEHYAVAPNQIGVLTVWSDVRFVHEGFERRAALALLFDMMRNIVLAFVLIAVFRSRLTGPIRRLAGRVLQIDPQSPIKVPLNVESVLKGSELDDLTNKMNALLSSMDNEMGRRQRAESEVRTLNEKLEEKVRVRTQALHESNQQLQTSLDELHQTQNLLVKAQQMASLAQLAGGMAHEINNPVAVVYSNIATLSDYLNDLIELAEISQEADAAIQDEGILNDLKQLRKQLDFDFVKEDAPDLVKTSKQSLERVRNIVEELQTFVGGEDHDKQAVQLGDLFMQAASETGLDNNEDINLTHNFDLVVDPVQCNARQVRMILAKILSNAADAMPCGGTLEVALAEEDDFLYLAIKDDGVGMSEEDLQCAVNPFFTRKEVGQGMGMGLTVAYNVMANHNGELLIESAPDVGTVVTLKFPR